VQPSCQCAAPSLCTRLLVTSVLGLVAVEACRLTFFRDVRVATLPFSTTVLVPKSLKDASGLCSSAGCQPRGPPCQRSGCWGTTDERLRALRPSPPATFRSSANSAGLRLGSNPGPVYPGARQRCSVLSLLVTLRYRQRHSGSFETTATAVGGVRPFANAITSHCGLCPNRSTFFPQFFRPYAQQ